MKSDGRTLIDVWGDSGQRDSRCGTEAKASPKASSSGESGVSWISRVNFEVGANWSTLVFSVLTVAGFVAVHGGTCCKNRPLANEVSAIGALRTFRTAQIRYRDADPSEAYAGSLAELSEMGTELVDDVLGSGSKQGFNFRIASDPEGDTWDAEAHAATVNTGRRRFYLDRYGDIFVSEEDPTRSAPLTGGRGGPPPGFRRLGQ